MRQIAMHKMCICPPFKGISKKENHSFTMSEEFNHTHDPQIVFANKSYSVTAVSSSTQSTINHVEANIYVTISKKTFHKQED